MRAARALRVSAIVLGSAVLVTGCGGRGEGSGADRFRATPNSCGLLRPDVVHDMVGDSVAGEYIEGSASAAIQECAWGTVIHVEQPDAKSGRVTVFVDAEKAGPAGSGVQQVTKVYGNELDAAGCAAVGADVHVDKSCVPSEGGIRLVAFRTSNLFVRITCSVRNPDVCSGGRRSATAETLTKAVLRNL